MMDFSLSKKLLRTAVVLFAGGSTCKIEENDFPTKEEYKKFLEEEKDIIYEEPELGTSIKHADFAKKYGKVFSIINLTLGILAALAALVTIAEYFDSL